MIGADQPATGRGNVRSDDPAMPVAAVLAEEFRLLHPGPTPPSGRSLEEFFTAVEALPDDRTALCLSGGGIRSACFGLGVLQALARRRLLGQFHYLSTVSGGGYIGSWLSAWRHHARDDGAILDKLATRCRQPAADARSDPFAEPVELEGLRRNSNFLTPKLGMTSADTWTVIALCSRNLLLNWTIFGPLLLALVMMPQGAARFLGWASFWPFWAHLLLVAAAAAALFVALLVTTANRPLNRPAAGRDSGPDAAREAGRWPAPIGTAPVDQAIFMLWILLPCYLAGMFLAIFTIGRVLDAHPGALFILTAGAIIGGAIYAAAWLIARNAGPQPAKPRRHFLDKEEDTLSPAAEFVALTLSGVAAGLLIGIGIWVFLGYAPIKWRWEILVALGVPWGMTALLVADLLFTGLSSYARNGDFDREWSARASGGLGLAGLAWFLFAGVVLFGPALLQIGRPVVQDPFAPIAHIGNAIVAVAGAISGFITMKVGNSAKTAADAAGKWAEKLPLARLLSLATIVFLICLATFLAALTASSLVYLQVHLDLNTPGGWLLVTVAAAALCALVGAGASHYVNVNRFSLHDIYRNRLIRAFLGSARASVAHLEPKSIDPFTGFSRKDNLPMTRLRESVRPGQPGCLFHVVNIALNLVGGANLAWQERKAESFTVSPLHSGSASVGYRPSKHYGGPRGGITLGTAMAISGAAASPNQGYHSSPIIALIMMLFNVRLGWWLGNPANAKRIWRRDGPRWSFLPVLREMFGLTDDRSDWIYLSDGGHFENLGLYEMVRRRCRFILVSDAGCDPGCAYADLGSALRKIWIDFGIRVEFDRLDIAARQVPPRKGFYCALARVIYPEAPDRPGHLIYVKPGYHGTEPADIRAYASAEPTFPHESTADQWFSESQMESYRGLGAHIIERMSAPQPDEDAAPRDLPDLLRRVRLYLRLDDQGGAMPAPAEAAE
jgi:Patatin-like phospholipase